MAAIAYVTDEKMLEYFRFNGLDSIVFWRLSSKNFSDFKPGDLLFFLSKENEIKKSREKGIVGYGCFEGRNSISIDTMWKKYGTKTGYNTKNELLEAIKKSCKAEELPKKIDCLRLEHVMFFQSPIYLSDLGYNVSSKLESFMYLDRNEGNQTLKLLEEAKNAGIDLWSASQGNGDDEAFDQQLIQYQISTIFEEMEIDTTVHNSTDIIKKYGNDKSVWINHKHYAFMDFKPEKKIYYLFDSNNREIKENYFKMIGYLTYIKEILNQRFGNVKLAVISTKELNPQQIKILTDNEIEYNEY